MSGNFILEYRIYIYIYSRYDFKKASNGQGPPRVLFCQMKRFKQYESIACNPSSDSHRWYFEILHRKPSSNSLHDKHASSYKHIGCTFI